MSRKFSAKQNNIPLQYKKICIVSITEISLEHHYVFHRYIKRSLTVVEYLSATAIRDLLQYLINCRLLN